MIRAQCLCFCLILLLAPVCASANTFLICHVGGPGTSEQAAPKLALFLRHLEKILGLNPNSFDGLYLNKESACAEFLKEKSPLMVVADLPTLLRNFSAWELSPVAFVGDEASSRYHLLSSKPEIEDLKSSGGRSLAWAGTRDMAFLRQVVFDGAVDPALHFELKHQRRVLKGVRGVSRGKYDLVLVDQAAYAHLSELDLPTPLKEVFRSEPLPGLTLSARGTLSADQKKLVAKIKKALPKLCQSSGKDLCASLEVDSFTPVHPKKMKKLLKRYEKK